MQLCKPETLKDAKKYVHSRVRKHWPGSNYGWYSGEVVKVFKDAVDPDTGELIHGIWFTCRFEDKDQPQGYEDDDVEWDELVELMENMQAYEVQQQDDGAAAAAADTQTEAPSHKRKAPAGAADGGVAEPSAAGRGAAAGDFHTPKRPHTSSQPGHNDGHPGGTDDHRPSQRQRHRHHAPGSPDPLETPAQQQEGEPGARGRGHAGSADEDDVEVVAERIAPVHMPRPGEGHAGQLRRIHLVNFMCHENFELELGPNINLISGANGSGKSAIMQGLQACLGVSARGTGRAASLSHFIRTGAHHASVEVTIWNTGPEAYHPDIFGHQLTIERRLTPASSTYRIYDHQHRPAHLHSGSGSTAVRKDDVNAILDYFGIDAANPLTVITQDMARQFLNDSGPASKRRKMEMYLEGTGLVLGKTRLVHAREDVAAQHAGLKAAGEALKAQRLELREVEGRLRKLVHVDRLQAELEQIEPATVWALVLKARQHRDAALADLAACGPSRQAHEARAAELREQLRGLTGQEEEKRSALSRWQGETEEMTKAQRVAKKRLHAAAKRLLEKQGESLDAQAALEEIKSQQADLQVQMARDQSEGAERRRRAVEEHQARMAAIRQQRAAVDEEAAAADAARLEAEREEAELRQGEERLMGEIRSLQEQVHITERQLHEAEASQHSNVAKFGGKWMATLHDLVQRNAQRFSAKPIGPLGHYLKLPDGQKWAETVEVVVGGQLNNWIVNNNENDVSLLKALAAQAGLLEQNLKMYKTNFRVPRHNIPDRNRPQPLGRWTTLLDVVQVDVSRCSQAHEAAMVFNYLVDKLGAEAVVVCENSEEAQNVGHSGFAGNHIRSAADLQGTRYVCMGPTGNSKAVNLAKKVKPRLGLSSGDLLRQIHETLAADRAAVAEAEGRLAQAQAQLAGQRPVMERIAVQRRELQKTRRHLEDQLREASDALARIESEGAGGAFLQVLAEMTADMTQRESVLRSSQAEAQALEAQVAALRQEVAQGQEALEGRAGQLSALESSLLSLGQQRASLAQELEGEERRARQQAELRAQREEELKQAKQDVKEAEESALQVCPEAEGLAAVEGSRASLRLSLMEKAQAQMRQGRTCGDPEAEVNAAMQTYLKDEVRRLARRAARLDQEIKAAHKEAGGQKEELEMTRDGLMQKISVAERQYNTHLDKYKVCAEGLTKRDVKYKEVSDNTQEGVHRSFAQFMTRRKHLGQVMVDEDRQELRIRVKVNGVVNEAAQWVEDLKQLSGGERSFTTVALLLAMGSWTGSPFRCMDEFDVFMDAINRRVATETLIEFAMENPDKQFIFLTPQDLQAVQGAQESYEAKSKKRVPDGFIKVFQMRPPRPGGDAGRRGR